MKRTLIAFAIALSATAAVAEPAQYAGTWTLSKADSKGLPKTYDTVTDSTIVVTQDAKAFSIDVTLHAEGRPEYKEVFTYPMDGTVKEIESTVRTPNGPMKVPTTLSAHSSESGLELTETRTVNFGDIHDRFTSVELWKLSEDGRTLTVHRTDQRPQGVFEYDMVFHRK